MYRRNFHKGNYKDMRKYLAKLDWNNMLRNKTAVECWNILKYETESIIDKFVPLKNKGNSLQRNLLKKLLKILFNNLRRGFMGAPERMKTLQISKRHLMQLRLKLDSLKEAMGKN